MVVRYSYDAWGKPSVRQDDSGIFLALANPYLYRSYYYDWEIGKYYLQSRYYDPFTGRFINADVPVFLSLSHKCLLTNLYTYCSNNPVNSNDSTGYSGFMDIWEAIKLSFGFVKSIADEAYKACNQTKTLSQIKRISKQTGKSQKQVMRELKNIAKESSRVNKCFMIAGIVISIISVIIFAVSFLSSGQKLFADVYVLIVDLFIDALNWFICKIAELGLKFIPVGGIVISFAASWLIGMLISSFFTPHRREKMYKAYAARMNNSLNWYDWFINLLYSIEVVF